jgi:hypothetical protein
VDVNPEFRGEQGLETDFGDYSFVVLCKAMKLDEII